MDIAATRLRNQKLDRTDCQAPEAVVRWLGAVQAQEYAPARWAVGMRTRGATDADVFRACDEGRILRLHILRPTWHFVAPADIRWMLSISGPRVNAINAHYYAKLGLDDGIFTRSRRAIERALAKGQHLTRLELAMVLSKAGIEASGQRLAYLMMRAELDGVICNGACRGKQFTYALLDDRSPGLSRVSRDEALATLATRYFSSHGPATLRDYVWWSGLTVKDARSGIEGAGAALPSHHDRRSRSTGSSSSGKGQIEARSCSLRSPAPRLRRVSDCVQGPRKHSRSRASVTGPGAHRVPALSDHQREAAGTWKRTSRAASRGDRAQPVPPPDDDRMERPPVRSEPLCRVHRRAGIRSETVSCASGIAPYGYIVGPTSWSLIPICCDSGPLGWLSMSLPPSSPRCKAERIAPGWAWSICSALLPVAHSAHRLCEPVLERRRGVVSPADRHGRHHKRQVYLATSGVYPAGWRSTRADRFRRATEPRSHARAVGLSGTGHHGRHLGVDALFHLARFVRRTCDRSRWEGSVASWRPAIRDLASHLIAKHQVPAFLTSAWYADDARARRREAGMSPMVPARDFERSIFP